MLGVLIIIAFMLMGFFFGMNIVIPYVFYKYIAVAILACLDSVFGAIIAHMNKKYNNLIFLSGFFGNSIIAIILVYIGDKLAVDIYLAAVIVFSSRIINNFSTIRRDYINSMYKKAKKKNFIKNINK